MACENSFAECAYKTVRIERGEIMIEKLTKISLAVAALGVALSLLEPQVRLFGEMSVASTPPAATDIECFAPKLWQADAPSVNAGHLPQLLKVPVGWAVMGGTTANFGQMTQPAAILCRPVDSKPLPLAPPLKLH